MTAGYGVSSPPDSAAAAAVEEQAVAWSRTMLLIRRFEERAGQLTDARQGTRRGAPRCRPGSHRRWLRCRAVPGDTVSAPHRGHHHALAKGISPDGLMAELYGKATGVSEAVGVRCTSQGSMWASSDPMASWGPPWGWPSATPSLRTTGVSNVSPWRFSVTVGSIPAVPGKPSTSRARGGSPWLPCARTTCTPWKRRPPL